MSRKLRWFERRKRPKLHNGIGDKHWQIFFGRSLVYQALIVSIALFAVGTLIIAGFVSTIPTELHVLIDGYSVSGLLLDSVLAATVSLLIARVTLPIVVMATVSVDRLFSGRFLRNEMRKVYVYSWRNGFHHLLYPVALGAYTFGLFLFFSFGLFLGFAYFAIYLIVIGVCGTLLIIGDIMGLLLATKEAMWSKKLSAIEGSEPPQWFAVVVLAAMTSLTSFSLGVGISVKRHAEIVEIEVGDIRRGAAIIVVTDDGLIARFSDTETTDRGAYSFLPFLYSVNGMP